jgi:hypothetical protein
MPEIGRQWKAEARDDSGLVRLLPEEMTDISLTSAATAFEMISNTPTNTFEETRYDSYANSEKQNSSNLSFRLLDLALSTVTLMYGRMLSLL